MIRIATKLKILAQVEGRPAEGRLRKYRDSIRILSLFLFLTVSSTCLASWHIVVDGRVPHHSFQAAVTKQRILYLCRDLYSTNFGIIKDNSGCQLITGDTLITQGYQILVDPDHNFYWKEVVRGVIPIGAFDGGREPILGKKYLCLKQIHRFSYLGYVIKNQCRYRTKDHTHHSRKYKILTNYWVKSNIIPKNIPPSGKNAWGDLYICRVKYNQVYIPGSTGRGMEVCQFIDEYGTKKESKEYEVQLRLPHKWRKVRSITDNIVKVGNPSRYYICRAKLATRVYIGKRGIAPQNAPWKTIPQGVTPMKVEGRSEKTDFCHISLENGSLRIKNYQLQFWANQ